MEAIIAFAITLARDLYVPSRCSNYLSVGLEDKMSQARMNRLYQIVRALGLAALLWIVATGLGCVGALSSSPANPPSQPQNDPLHLGASPGPLGSTNPQTVQVRLGSEPNDRIVSLSLTLNSLQATNSGNGNLELLAAPVTVEFTHSAVISEPILIRQIYQDTYSALVFPAMTGQVVFYGTNGTLTTQSLNIAEQTVSLSPNVVLGTDDPLVLSAWLDLAQTFTVGDSVTVKPLVVATQSAVPAPPVPPAVGQPETGSISFLVGTVLAVDMTAQTISIQPASGDAIQMSYDNAGGTTFVNCDPSTLTGMLIESEAVTQADGSVLATEVEGIDTSQRSELYGLLSGYAPDGVDYNLIVEGGDGANVTSGLIGQNVTVDWVGSEYSVNSGRLDLSSSQDLVFDETRTFPGQFVEVEWDTLQVPDPESTNAGYMTAGMFELEEQTLSGQVLGYGYDSGLGLYTFTLNVDANAPIRRMNPGLTIITVRMIPQTYLRNNPIFENGKSVKVRGLLFADPNCNSTNYQPGDPVAFIMVADRISK